jgi:hypothetical protein
VKRVLVAVQNAALLTVVFCASCTQRPLLFDRDWPDAYWRSGDYVLIAIDTEAQMSLKIDDVKHWEVFHEVVSATVYAVGANDRYIVAKQHPLLDDQTHFDRTVTNYFIVD